MAGCRAGKSILHDSAAAEERDVEKLKLEKDQMNQDILESERQAPHCKHSSASEVRLFRLARSFFGNAKLRSRGRCTWDAVSSGRRVLDQPVLHDIALRSAELFAQSPSSPAQSGSLHDPVDPTPGYSMFRNSEHTEAGSTGSQCWPVGCFGHEEGAVRTIR